MEWFFLILFIPYIYILLKIYKSLTGIKPYLPSASSPSFVSVVVACRNEEKNLPGLLSAVASQTYDTYELIIIDDNSSDRTFSTASEYRGITNLRVLKNKGRGKKQAIGTGVKAAEGNLIITTDADCRMDNKWLTTIASFFEENKPGLIICPVKLKSSRNYFLRLQELEFLSLQGITAGAAAAGNPVMCNGANLAFDKEAWIKNSGNLHDELVSGDDVFLLHSMKRENKNKILWLDSFKATVTTAPAVTIKSFFSQRSRWLSKAGYYNDPYTLLLAIVTFVTILTLTALLAATLFSIKCLPVFLAAILLKSIPDYLILKHMALKYNAGNLMKFFIPAQIAYPVYIMITVLLAALTMKKSSFNYPSPKGT